MADAGSRWGSDEAAVWGSSEAVTSGVRVSVLSRYLPERSNAFAREFLFGYDVTIKNESSEAVRLVTRHWVIRDAMGEEEEVEGVGVVGETPIIAPGETHQYASFCRLRTEFGTMEGSYGMVRPGGETFRVDIAPFSLLTPTAVN